MTGAGPILPTVVVACDKFKGSLTAEETCAAIAAGIARARPDARVLQMPVADGGEGTVTAALRAGFTPVRVRASGPLGDPIVTTYARRGDTAVVEVAEVCGFARLPGGWLAPMTAGTRGVGEVVAAAVGDGCRHIVLAVGGSTSTDGGAGLVQALGARVRDSRGHDVAPGGAALAAVSSADVAPLRARLSGVTVTLACDVDNPLEGATGAARVYAPQKGADPHQVDALDAALHTWADVVADATGADHRFSPGAGAAGGVGFAAIALLGATVRPGIDLLLDLLDIADHIRSADLVVTGEGSLDEQTLRGKVPVGVARTSQDAGVPVVAACGLNRLSATALRAMGVGAVYSCEDLEPDQERSMAQAAQLVEEIGRRIALAHLVGAQDGPAVAAARTRQGSGSHG